MKADKNNLPILVIIGVFSQELAALKEILMPSASNTNLAFIVISHLTENNKRLLPEILQDYTQLKVLPIKDRQHVKANHVYVLPPGKNITISNNIFALSDQKPNEPSPFDFFLCSAALNQHKDIICIILSSVSHDGLLGLRHLREHMCLIIAQKEKHKHYDMPKNAINSGLVDYILQPKDIYPFLLKYVAHANDKTIHLEDNIPTELHKILMIIKKQIGHDFSLYKPNTIFRRIYKRMDTLHIDTLSVYVNYLHHYPAETIILFKELLINVTNFFRDLEAFEQLKQALLNQKIIEQNQDKGLRIWVPGCSTGEEAYTIAIILLECMSLLDIHPNVQIFATDIDAEAIETARAGIFPERIEKHVSPERLNRFFVKLGSTYKINTVARKMIIFAVQNVIKDPPFTKLNILSCRNLLIYLKSDLQKKILPLFHYSLNPHGLLFLGTSENIGGSVDYFNIVDKKWKIFERKYGVSPIKSTMNIASTGQLLESTHVKVMEKIMHEIEQYLSKLVKSLILEQYTPACIVIDENGDIVYTYGRTGKFLEFASGTVRLHFLDMIHPELKSSLHIAICKASEQQKEMSINGLKLSKSNRSKYLNIKIKPINEIDTAKHKLLLIIIAEVTLPESPSTLNLPFHEIAMTHEFDCEKETLQTTIEELETSNEELKSSNEELQSTNEELQSLNEEMTTVNAELANRIEQLSSAHEDIKNLLDNTEIATIVLDRNLCIKQFTPKATDIINLIPTDLGRPIGHIVSNLQYDQLIEDARMVLNTLEPVTSEGIDKNGQSYFIRLIPHRSASNHVDGVIVTFSNIYTHKEAEAKLNQLEIDLSNMKEFNHVLLNTITDSAIILDKNKNIILANYQFLKQFKLKMENILGFSLYELKLSWDSTQLKNIIEQALQDTTSSSTSKLEISHNKQIQLINITVHKISNSIILLILS